MNFLIEYGILLGYFGICALSAITLKHFVKVPKEIFRKTLHFILLGSIFILVYVFESWWTAAIATVIFTIMVYPILLFAERIPSYSALLTERKCGEIKRSLVVVFSMFFILICVCWGWLGYKYLVVASVIAWGFGDAAAALVGKRFGKRYIEGKLVEGRKSIEGTLAMFLISFVSVLIVLSINVPMHFFYYFLIAFITAAVCAVVELYTKCGMDTLTCPFSAAFTMIVLLSLLGGVNIL